MLGKVSCRLCEQVIGTAKSWLIRPEMTMSFPHVVHMYQVIFMFKKSSQAMFKVNDVAPYHQR